MTVWELMKQLSEAEPEALVHFKVNLSNDLILELAENGEAFIGEPFNVVSIYADETDVDINLEY